jgi:uncharacterized damage-inducible protein DinB
MSLKEFHLLIEHDAWANERIAAALLSLAELPEKPKKFFDHILGAQHNWISRMYGETPSIEIWPQLSTSTWQLWMARNLDDLKAITSSANALERIVTYTNSSGKEFSNPISELLLHVSLHSQYHRGQIITSAREVLHTVPVTDMIAFLRSR